MKLEAEAEGKKKSLLAEAEGFEAMVKAAERNPEIAIQYKMVDQWKEIASEQVKAFEHIQLGNVTVFDGGNGTTSNFLAECGQQSGSRTGYSRQASHS